MLGPAYFDLTMKLVSVPPDIVYSVLIHVNKGQNMIFLKHSVRLLFCSGNDIESPKGLISCRLVVSYVLAIRLYYYDL